MTLLTQVRLIIDEPSGPKFWPNQQIYDAINESSIEVLGSGQFELTTATMTATASASYAMLPTTIMIPKFILSTGTEGRELPKTTYAALEQESLYWGTATGTEHIAFVEYDYESVRLFPIVGTAIVYRVIGVPYPTEVAVGVEDMGTNDMVSDAVKFLAGSCLMEATRPDVSEALRVEGGEHLQEAMRHKRNNQTHNLWQLQPAGRINARRSGDMSVIRGYR
jgi:hypothetical protein